MSFPERISVSNIQRSPKALMSSSQYDMKTAVYEAVDAAQDMSLMNSPAKSIVITLGNNKEVVRRFAQRSIMTKSPQHRCVRLCRHSGKHCVIGWADMKIDQTKNKKEGTINTKSNQMATVAMTAVENKCT